MSDTQTELTFVDEEGIPYRTAFMEYFIKEIIEDDEPYHKRAMHLLCAYNENPKIVDICLMTMSGWCYDTIRKKAIEAVQADPEHYEL